MTYKLLFSAVALTLALTACSSDDDSSTDDTGGGTTDGGTTDGGTTDGGSTDGGTTDGGSTDGGTTDGGGTDGGSTDGGSTNSGQLSGNVTDWGFITIESGGGEVDPTAGFGRFSADFPASAVADEFNPSSDSCEVTRTALGDIDTDLDLDFDTPFTFISAGENVIISSPGGTYATLTQTRFGDFIFYGLEDSLSGAAPAGLVADIPGDQFMAMSNLSIPDAPSLEVSSPAANGLITPTTQFTWTANGTSDTSIEINASAFDIAANSTVTVDCTVVDDGSFEFSSATQAELGDTFMGTGFVSRSANNIVQNGSTVVVLSHTVEP